MKPARLARTSLISFRSSKGNDRGRAKGVSEMQDKIAYRAFINASAAVRVPEQSGAASSNPSQYTGRDNDGTGLYYYRARYYSPTSQRFIGEDPAGVLGGINLYAYALNNPISFTDPSGLSAIEDIAGGLVRTINPFAKLPGERRPWHSDQALPLQEARLQRELSLYINPLAL